MYSSNLIGKTVRAVVYLAVVVAIVTIASGNISKLSQMDPNNSLGGLVKTVTEQVGSLKSVIGDKGIIEKSLEGFKQFQNLAEQTESIYSDLGDGKSDGK